MSTFAPPGDFRTSLFKQVERCVLERVPPMVAEIYLPVPRPAPDRDAEFGVVVLADGSAGLYYAWLGGAQASMARRFEASVETGSPALELARLYLGDDEAERSLGLAAINAITSWWWRERGCVPPAATNSFGVALQAGDRVGFIGNFAPLVRQAMTQGFPVVVVERKAHLWREAPGLRVTGDPNALAPCSVVVATASMCLNDTLDDMLPYCMQARAITLIGPTAGFFPELLFERGITAVGGLQLLDAPMAIRRMRDGAKWNDCARRYVLGAGRTVGP